MHRNLLLVFILSFATLAALPQPAAAQSTYEGFVCSSEEGCWRGIPGATVVFTKAGAVSALDERHETTTGKGGFFSFAELDGEYSVTIQRAGFTDFAGSASANDGEGQFSLEPKRVTVSGTVRGPDGAIQQGTVATWTPQGHVEAVIQNGAYSMQVTAGHRQMEVRATGFQTLHEERFVTGSGQDFTLQAIPGQTSTVQGTVLDQDGKAVAGARVNMYQYGAYEDDAPKPASSGSEPAIARPDYGYGEQQTTTDANGKYSLPAREGDVSLSVWKDGYAGANAWFNIDADSTHTHDFTLHKYPDRSVHLSGKVTDARSGDGLRYASIHIQYPEFGLWACSQDAADARNSDTREGVAYSEPYHNPGCDIIIQADGSFAGDVYPGYAMISVWYDHWRSCSESRSSDGSMTRDCGPQYYGLVQTTRFAENESVSLDLALQARPGPDAKVDGWVLDAAGNAIPGARVSFSNQDSYGWGEAITDADGSYAVRIHSGYLHVSVWADGYLPWQGTVSVGKGGHERITLQLTEGDASYGHCCYAYAEDHAVMESSGDARAAGAPSQGSSQAGFDGDSGSADEGGFEDLGGGLGPYDPKKASVDGEDSPGLSVLAALAVIGLALYVRRK